MSTSGSDLTRANERLEAPRPKYLLIQESPRGGGLSGQHTVTKKRAASLRPFLVELPGIEPAAESSPTCGNIGFDNAEQRETT
jgi:hypothetical protein